jgi:PAS domain S-box-containing protein
MLVEALRRRAHAIIRAASTSGISVRRCFSGKESAMPTIYWIILVLCFGSVAGLAMVCFKKDRRLKKQQALLRSATLKIRHMEEEKVLKSSQRDGQEEKLRSYLHLLDTLINTIPNPIYFKDADGVFQGCNKVFAKSILGLTRDRIIGVRPQELPDRIPPELASTYQSQEMAMGEKTGFHSFEATVQCADGTRRDFLFSMAPFLDPKDQTRGSVTVLSDLTDKNRAIEDRLQKEKLEGVLETAGGICHEFNQPLQALSGNLELLAAKADSREHVLRHIEKAWAQIERMRVITARLQGITHYENMPYSNNTKIIDIHKSSR